jgi:hypothetical protein
MRKLLTLGSSLNRQSQSKVRGGADDTTAVGWICSSNDTYFATYALCKARCPFGFCYPNIPDIHGLL